MVFGHLLAKNCVFKVQEQKAKKILLTCRDT